MPLATRPCGPAPGRHAGGHGPGWPGGHRRAGGSPSSRRMGPLRSRSMCPRTAAQGLPTQAEAHLLGRDQPVTAEPARDRGQRRSRHPHLARPFPLAAPRTPRRVLARRSPCCSPRPRVRMRTGSGSPWAPSWSAARAPWSGGWRRDASWPEPVTLLRHRSGSMREIRPVWPPVPRWSPWG